MSQNEISEQQQLYEQLYISNLVYRYGPTKYKGRQYIQPIYSDEEWDALVEQHKDEYEQFLNTVPTSIQLLPQIEHPIICGSLQKYTSKTYGAFLNRIRKLKNLDNDKGFILTPKYDGCSMRMYFYPDGNVLCMNRNECDYGVNLTARCGNILKQINTKYIKQLIQKHNLACVAIRGEIIISQKTFQEKYANTYASAQNVTTAQITCMKEPINSDFVIYEFLPIKLLQRGEEIVDLNLIQTYLYQLSYARNSILQSDQNEQQRDQQSEQRQSESRQSESRQSKSRQRVFISSFKKCEYKDITDENLFRAFYDEQNNNPYPCDGVVIKLNTYQKALFENKQKPLYQVAYKFEQDNYQTTPVKMEWSVNSQYELIPTLVVEPVKIGPKMITRIAMSNLNKCLEYDIFNKIQQKKQISVCLAGQIIPQLSKVEQVFSLEVERTDKADKVDQAARQQQCYMILNDLRNKPPCCPLCQSEAIKLICTQSIKGGSKSVHYKYICSERKCRNKIISTKFLKHFKPYLKSVKLNGKQSIGAATLNKMIVENNNNLDATIVQILNNIYANLSQGSQIDKNVYYLTFCDNETETSIKQKIEQNQEQTLIDSMFFNLSVRNMNLPLISQFIQKNVILLKEANNRSTMSISTASNTMLSNMSASNTMISSNEGNMVRISSQLRIDTSELTSQNSV